MEQLNKAIDKAMDSLKPDQQDKQTGSVERCERHNMDLVSYAGEMVCTDCLSLKSDISHAHFDLNLPERLKKCSFDNYKPVNQTAKDIKDKCVEYTKEWDTNSGGIIMLGSVGTGKTHIATAISKGVCDTGNKAHMTTIPIIIRTIRSSWKKGATDNWGSSISEEDVIRDYSQKWKLLVIDEIGSQYGSDSEKIIISEIINNRYNNMLPTIIIGNVTLSEAEDYLGKRVIDRIKEGGKVLIFDWESHRKLAD